MKKLLNTLYVTSENSYLALDGENIVIYDDKKELGRVPLHILRELYHSDIGEPARHLWVPVQNEIFLCVT